MPGEGEEDVVQVGPAQPDVEDLDGRAGQPAQRLGEGLRPPGDRQRQPAGLLVKLQLGVCQRTEQLAEVADALRPLAHGEVQRDEQTRRLSLPVTGGTDTLAEALRRLSGTAVQVLDIGLRRPDLDDVFLTLTGHAAQDAEPADGAAGSASTVTAGAAR